MPLFKLIIRINKNILDKPDKYIYAWDANESLLCGGWPGTKSTWIEEKDGYYCYYHNFNVSLNGTTINYIINVGDGGANNQTNDLTVTLDGAETTVTIESTDVKK